MLIVKLNSSTALFKSLTASKVMPFKLQAGLKMQEETR